MTLISFLNSSWPELILSWMALMLFYILFWPELILSWAALIVVNCSIIDYNVGSVSYLPLLTSFVMEIGDYTVGFFR
jgi:hypothetical protein